MTQEHPITPPPELIYEWAEDRELLQDPLPLPEYIANCAAQWGADQELEACCQWISDDAEALRIYRRPQPPSLKEQALLVLDDANLDAAHHNILLRALEQLDD